VPSVADELRDELTRLIAEGAALQRGLAINTGDYEMADFESEVKEAVNRLAEKAKAEGGPRPKGTQAERVASIMKKWVLDFRKHYESWYSEALAVVSQVLPDRTADFRDLYKLERRKEIDYESYTLADYQISLRITRGYLEEPVFDPDNAAFTKFTQQLQILTAAKRVLDSRLADIRGVLQADLFDSELDAARELLKHGFLRAAGMVAGVVLEGHLRTVARAHKVVIRSKAPTIAHYNDALKAAGILAVPRWRSVQGLTDIRNLCGHATGREPTADEVRELIDGVAKIAKTVS
jgi:hypothetical protein